MKGSPKMMISAKQGVNLPKAFLKSSVTSLHECASFNCIVECMMCQVKCDAVRHMTSCNSQNNGGATLPANWEVVARGTGCNL